MRALSFVLLASLLVACTEDDPVTCESDSECPFGCNVALKVCNGFDAGVDGPVDAATTDVSVAVDASMDAAEIDTRPTCTEAACMAAGQHCSMALGRCVACAKDDHCPDTAPVCDEGTGTCGACMSNTDCTGRAGKAVCGGAGIGCVECAASKDCNKPTSPICRANTCQPCRRDQECADREPGGIGVCMSHDDGHCATESEAIWVQNKPGTCVETTATFPPDTGTKAKPYCESDPAVSDAGKGNKRLVIVRGPEAATEIAATVTGKPVLVVGRDNATIVPGARVGIRVNSGELHVRGLKIAGSTTTGVVVEAAGTLVMSRSTVENNRQGIQIKDGGGFDITNTVIANNTGEGLLFGGVSLSAGPGKRRRFEWNTIVGNKSAGLVCAENYPTKGLLFTGNAPSDSLICVLDATSKAAPAAEAKLDANHRLQAGSVCINQVTFTPADGPHEDIDGDVRPMGDKLDCGADEWKMP